MSMSHLKNLTVDSFPASTERPKIFAERLASDIEARQLVGELWVDGSFLTQKFSPEPDDIDVTFTINVAQLEARDASVQHFVMHTLNGYRHYSALLDTYICIILPREDRRHIGSMEAYWAEKWGVEWDGQLKGFAVVKFGECDVWLRLFA